MRRTRREIDLDESFARCEAAGLLLTPASRAEEQALYRRRIADEVVTPFPRQFARVAYWESLANRPRLQALHVAKSYARDHPDKVLCFYTAALLHGLWISNALLGSVHAACGLGGNAKSNAYITWHRICTDDVSLVNGCLVTSLERTLLDCARTAAFPEALALVDCALRYEMVRRDRLIDYACKNGAYLHGRERALRAFDYADGRSENGGESIFRGLIIQKGYMPPTELQREFRDPISGKILRVDAYWLLPNGREVIGELDGKEKYVDEGMLAGRTTTDALIAERQRESHLTALGIPVMRIYFRRLREPGYLEARLDAFGIPRMGKLC